MTTMADPKVYTVEEVAEILKINQRTVYRMLERGELKGFKIGPMYRISHENLDAFIRGER